MEGLVNYSSEDETEENLHSKAAEFSGGCSGKGSVRARRRSNSSSDSADDSPYVKSRKRSEEEYRNDLAKPTKRSNRYHNDDEDKYNKAAKTSERDEYERRGDVRESKDYAAKERNHREDIRVHDDKSRKHVDYKKYDDRYQSRYESNQNRDYRQDEKRIRPPSRHDDNKSYHKGVYDMRRSRYEDKRSHNEGRRDERRDQRHISQYPSSYQRKRSPTPPQRNSSKRFDKRDEYYSSKRDGNGQCARYSRSHSRSRSTDRPIQHSHSQSSSTNSRQSKELDAEVQTASLQSHEKNFAIAYNTNKLPSARNFEHLCNLPLNNQTVTKQANVANSYDHSNTGFGSVGFGTTNADVPQLPSYYNPQIMNPNKYAQQVQKRKLLWGAKKNESVPTKWEHAQFSQDSDGKVASKFMRLMGIKSGNTSSDTAPEKSEERVPAPSSSISTDVKSREAMFSSMEQQYEVARQVTHTMRGVGLGFGNPSY